MRGFANCEHKTVIIWKWNLLETLEPEMYQIKIISIVVGGSNSEHRCFQNLKGQVAELASMSGESANEWRASLKEGGGYSTTTSSLSNGKFKH